MPEKTTCSELLAAAAIGAIARMETTKRKRTRFADRVMRPPLLDWTTRVRKSPGSLAECGLLRGLSEKTGSGSQAPSLREPRRTLRSVLEVRARRRPRA